uniref:Uncharacterized protein n=1 Tax=Ditylenchus dipsaci TaxID=166011 RepID=A0A915D4Q5_9BILA
MFHCVCNNVVNQESASRIHVMSTHRSVVRKLMFISSLLFAKPREDIRPLYRRIFTNKRLDIANKIVLRDRPLHRLRSSRGWFSHQVMGYLQSIRSSYLSIFMVGMVGGAIFELFKVNFEYKGINFYKVFDKKQVKTRLDAYEQMLIERDEASQ